MSFFLRLKDLELQNADVAKAWVKYGLSLFNVSKTNAVSKFYGEPIAALEKVWDSPIETSNNEKPTTSNFKESDTKNDSADEKFANQNFEDSKNWEKNTGLISYFLFFRFVWNCINVHFIRNFLETLLYFKSFDLSEYEKQVPATLIENTIQARELFNFTHSWLKKSKNFYSLQDHPMEYVNAVLDLSELYRYLAFFEEDIER